MLAGRLFGGTRGRINPDSSNISKLILSKPTESVRNRWLLLCHKSQHANRAMSQTHASIKILRRVLTYLRVRGTIYN